MSALLRCPVPRFPLIGAGGGADVASGLSLWQLVQAIAGQVGGGQGRGRERHPTLSSVNEDQDDWSRDDAGDQDDAAGDQDTEIARQRRMYHRAVFGMNWDWDGWMVLITITNKGSPVRKHL